MTIEQAFATVLGGEGREDRPDYGAEIITVGTFGGARKFPVSEYESAFSNVTYRTEYRAYSMLSAMATNIAKAKEAAGNFIARASNSQYESGSRAEIEAAFDKWAEKHIGFWLSYIERHRQLASPMITGPANFPVNRQRKRNDAADRHYEAIKHHYDKGIKAIARAAFPNGDPKGPIKSGDPEALDKLREKLADLEAKQEQMKRARADVRKALKYIEKQCPDEGFNADTWQDKVKAKLVAMGYDNATSYAYSRAYCGRIVGPESFELSNNSANIRRIKNRIKGLESQQEAGTREQTFMVGVDEIKIIQNTEIMRIQFIFPGKPPADQRAIMKKNGFRWAPSQNAWQRHLNGAGQWAAECAMKQLAGEE